MSKRYRIVDSIIDSVIREISPKDIEGMDVNLTNKAGYGLYKDRGKYAKNLHNKRFY